MAAMTFWLTGLSGAGKSTLSQEFSARLQSASVPNIVLDGDVLRQGLCADLGFSHEDRSENIRRVAHVCRLFNDAGLTVIVALISPYRADRELAGTIIRKQCFQEIHVSTELAICERRDPKGLYARAKAGELKSFTGISAPYEAPTDPALSLDTDKMSLEQCIEALSRIQFGER